MWRGAASAFPSEHGSPLGARPARCSTSVAASSASAPTTSADPTSRCRRLRTGRRSGRWKCRAQLSTARAGAASTLQSRQVPRNASSSSRSPRRIGDDLFACRPGRRDDRQGAGARAWLPHRRRDGADAGSRRIRPRRGLLLHRRAERGVVAATAAAFAAAGSGADGALLVVQLRASGADEAPVRVLSSPLHHLAANPARRPRLAASGIRVRGAAQLLALPARALALARRGRAGAAALLVRGADVLPRASRLLRHSHLRGVGRRRRRMVARFRSPPRRDLRRRARSEAQRMVPAAGAARPRVALAARRTDRGAASAAVDAALAPRVVLLLAAPLARSAAPSARLGLLPHAPCALRLVVLRPGPARAALPRRVPAGRRRDGPSGSHGAAARRSRKDHRVGDQREAASLLARVAPEPRRLVAVAAATL